MVPLGPPDTVIPLVAAADVARVATNLLLDPSRDVDSVCRLAGEMLTVGEVADAFSAAAGHEVKYVDAPPDEWRHQALAAGFDPHAVEHLSKLWEIFRGTRSDDSLYRVTGSIEQIGGQRPVTLREFLHAHAHAGQRSA